MAKGFIEFEGLDPVTGGSGLYKISLTRIERISRYHRGTKLDDLFCVQNTAVSPKVAFRGIRNVDGTFCDPEHFRELPDPDGLCLASVQHTRKLDDRLVPPPEGFTFVVFADRQRVIDDWGWIQSDPDEPSWPIGWESRFAELIWPKN